MDNQERADVAILGGGWAGLLAARELRRVAPGLEIRVLEAATRREAGGLLQSRAIGGHIFDCGGPHILFSKFPETLAEVKGILGPNSKTLPRRNFIRFDGQVIQYPFENGLYELPAETRARLGSGLIRAEIDRASHPDWAPRDFLEWIRGFFGSEIAKDYLEPYNSKVWKRQLGSLSADWVFTPGRVPTPSLEETVRAIAGIRSVGYREQAEFIYPREGGIQSLYSALLSMVEDSGVDVIFDQRVKSLVKSGKGWRVNDSVSAGTVLSTIPLPELVGFFPDYADSASLANVLDYNRVLVVGVALDQPDPNMTAVYVPNPEVPFHRYTWMSYLNPPRHGNSHLIAEVTIPRDDRVDIPGVVRGVEDGLIHLGVASDRESIRFVEPWLNEYGYPVYRLGHAEVKRRILQRMAAERLFSVGRWGSWEYWNTDMVLRAVKRTVASLVSTLGVDVPAETQT